MVQPHSESFSLCTLSFRYVNGNDGRSCQCTISERRVCTFIEEGSTSKLSTCHFKVIAVLFTAVIHKHAAVCILLETISPSFILSGYLLRFEIWHIAKQTRLLFTFTTNPQRLVSQLSPRWWQYRQWPKAHLSLRPLLWNICVCSAKGRSRSLREVSVWRRRRDIVRYVLGHHLPKMTCGRAWQTVFGDVTCNYHYIGNIHTLYTRLLPK